MLREWLTLLRLARKRSRSSTNYRQFQAYQGSLLVRHLRENGVLFQNTSVLDLACGHSRYSRALAEAGARVVAIDLRQPFDLVFCASLIEHVPDPAQLLREIRRLLTPEGLVYLSFPPFYSPVGGAPVQALSSSG